MKLAGLVICRSCGHEVFQAYCADGRYRLFDKTEMPPGSIGSWAWRKRQGMEETDLAPGHPLHFCYGAVAHTPSHTDYVVVPDLPLDTSDVIRPAPEPTAPVDVVLQGPYGAGSAYRWICAGCQRLTIGEPSYSDGNKWYCRVCTAR